MPRDLVLRCGSSGVCACVGMVTLSFVYGC
jgi:hypothetical protein